MRFAVVAPAFTVSLYDSDIARRPPMPIASVVSGKFKKQADADSETKGETKSKSWVKWFKRKQLTDYEKYIRQQDWYYQHSWFEKEYFIHKLKRKLMNILLDVWKNVNGKLLTNFYAEIEFHDLYGFYRAYMPIIIRCQDIKEGKEIIGQFVEQLRDGFGFHVCGIHVKEEIADKNLIETEKRKIIEGRRGDILGTIKFNVYVGKNTRPKLLDELPKSMIDETLLGSFKLITTEMLNFSVLHRDEKWIDPTNEFQIMLKLIENEIYLPNLTPEELKEKMLYQMNWKQGE